MSININDIINEAKNELEDLRVEGIKSAAYLELKSIFEEIKANPEIKTNYNFSFSEPCSGWKNGCLSYRETCYNKDTKSYVLGLTHFDGEKYSAEMYVFTRGPRGADKGYERKIFNDAKDGIKFIIKKLIS